MIELTEGEKMHKLMLEREQWEKEHGSEYPAFEPQGFDNFFTEEELAKQDRETAELLATPCYEIKAELSKPISTEKMVARIQEHLYNIKSTALA